MEVEKIKDYNDPYFSYFNICKNRELFLPLFYPNYYQFICFILFYSNTKKLLNIIKNYKFALF